MATNNGDIRITISEEHTGVSQQYVDGKVAQEATARQDADTAVTAAMTALVEAETNARTSAVNAETTARETADSLLSARITDNANGIQANANSIASEAATRASEDARIEAVIASNEQATAATIQGINSTISANELASRERDSALDSKIDAKDAECVARLAAERQAREASEALIRSYVDAKTAGALHYKGTVATVAYLPQTGQVTGDMYNVQADGQNYAWDGTRWDSMGALIDLDPLWAGINANESAISEEAIARQSADSTLQNNINTEASNRQSGDATLQRDITTETSRATTAETALSSSITAEATARQQADETIKSAIAAEATRAAGKENDLQETLNNIVAGGGSATTAGAVTLSAVDDLSASNLQQAVEELSDNNFLLEDKYVRILSSQRTYNIPLKNKRYIVKGYSLASGDSKVNLTIYLTDDTSVSKRINTSLSGTYAVLDLTEVGEISVITAQNNSADIPTAIFYKEESQTALNADFARIRRFETFAEMDACTSLNQDDVCILDGYYSRFDGGGGLWSIKASTWKTLYNSNAKTWTANNTIYINKLLQNGNFACLISNNNKLNVLQMGVRNDGVDCTDALQAACNTGAKILFFPGGRYYITRPIVCGSAVVLMGECNVGAGVDKFKAENPYWTHGEGMTNSENGRFTTIRFVPDAAGYCFDVKGGAVENISISANTYSMTNIGGGADNRTKYADPLKATITLAGVGGVTNASKVVGCNFNGFSGSAIDARYYSNITDCSFRNCNLCIGAMTDGLFSNIRAELCTTIIRTDAGGQIEGIRGDSIYGPVFDIVGCICQIHNVCIDFCVKSVVKFSGNAEKGSYISTNLSRICYNSWNNNLDEGGSIPPDECAFYVPQNITLRGLHISVSFEDDHSTDGIWSGRNENFFYPCIIGVDGELINLRADITYLGAKSPDTTGTYKASLRRRIVLGQNGIVKNGLLTTEENVYKLTNLDSTYSASSVETAF